MSRLVVLGLLGMFVGCGADRESRPLHDGGLAADDSSSVSDLDGASVPDAAVSEVGPSPGCAWVDARPSVAPSALWIVAEPSAIIQPPNAPPNVAWIDRTFREIVLSEQGALAPFGDRIRFGAIWHGVPDDSAGCPGLTTLPPAVGNFAALRASFPAARNSAASSKAQYALERIARDASDKIQNSVLYVVNNTPTPCADDQAMLERDGEGMSYGLMQVKALRARGIKTFVLSLTLGAGDSEPYSEDDYAAAGGTGQAFYANDVETMRMALDSIAGSLASCDITLEGTVAEGAECRGEVRMGTGSVPCNTPDGFRMKDRSTLELVGKACEDLRSKPDTTVSARFPCDVLVLL